MIEALGGNAYLNIEDVSQEGRTYGFHLGESEGVGVVFWRFYKFPDKERIELTKKRDVVYVYRGDKGFEITYKGTRSDEPKSVSRLSAAPRIFAGLGDTQVAAATGHRSVLRRAYRRRAERHRASHHHELEQSERHFVHRYQHAICR